MSAMVLIIMMGDNIHWTLSCYVVNDRYYYLTLREISRIILPYIVQMYNFVVLKQDSVSLQPCLLINSSLVIFFFILVFANKFRISEN